MKKLFVMMLALILALACIPAMAVTPVSEEVVTIPLAMASSSPRDDLSDYSIVKGFERDLGIRLDITCYSEEAWETQFTLMLASGTLPDVILNNGDMLTLVEVSDLGAQGYFMPLNDLIEKHAPNLVAMMEEYPDLRMYSTSADGNMYTIAGLGESTLGTVNRCWINRIWLENLGLDYPTSVEELKDVLIAFRDQDANGNGDPTDEIPMSNFIDHMQKIMVNNFGIQSANGIYLLDADEDGKVYLGETTENYKAYLKYMNDLWNENLLDHDNFIQTNEEFHAKGIEDRVGTFFDWAPFIATGKALDYDQNFNWLGALTSDYSDERTVCVLSHVTAKPHFIVNAKSEYGEEVVKLIDYLFSDEGKLTGKYGYEGQDYDMIDLTIPGLEDYSILKIRTPEGYTSTEDYRNRAVTPTDAFSPYIPAAGTYHAAAMAANAEQLEALLPMYGWGILVARDCLSNEEIVKVPAFPTLLYTEEESAERASLYTDISLYIESMHAQFITGVVDIDTGWDEFIQTLENMQLARLLEIEQAAYDRLVG